VSTGRLARRSARGTDVSEIPWGIVLAVAAGFAYVGGWAGGLGVSPWMNGLQALLAIAGAVWCAVESSPECEGVIPLGTGLICLVVAMGAARYLVQSGYPAYGLTYLAVAGVVTLLHGWRGLVAAGFAVALVVASHLTGTAPGVGGVETGFGPVADVEWELLGFRGVLTAGFGLLAFLVHGAALDARRERRQREVEQQREDLLRRAREFRLFNAGRSGTDERYRDEVEEYAVMDAVEAVERTIFETLSLLKTSLDCHTCVLLWFDVGRDSLHIKELVSDSDGLVEGELDPAQGVVGSIVRCRDPVRLENLHDEFRGLSYYRGSEPVSQFLGVPLLEGGHMRGILCVDRREERPFADDEVEIVQRVSRSILRSVENERIFRNVEATKFELGQFFSASRRLNSVLSMEDVLSAALQSAADVVDYDFAAVTVLEGGRHRVEAVDTSERFGFDGEQLHGRTFEPNSGLVSMAVANQHYLPYGGRLRDGETVVFTRDDELPELPSLLVLPLIVRDEAVGTLVVGTEQAGGISTERREMLEVITNQVAVSLQNARLYARMEQLATTDELTGLPNRRTFDQKLDEAIARHGRADRQFALVLLDIDHFKEVNDTWGHAVGDEVLEEVAAVLRESVREIDVPARYGGEEFGVILEETALRGSKRVAERIRREVADLQFRAEGETFRCTVSLGIGMWPRDGETAAALVDAADEALYASKEEGRNQVTARCDLR